MANSEQSPKGREVSRCPHCGHALSEELANICPSCAFEMAGDHLLTGAFDEPETFPEISGYRMLSLIGRGGMGDVFLAVQEKFERRVAIKVLRETGEPPPEVDLKSRFLQEARALSGLTHPNIVPVFDFGTTNAGQPYFAMEYMEGAVDLRTVLAEGPLGVETVFSHAIQVCKALEFAHAKGVIHRDVKPANVLVSPDGHIKLADFGLAKVKPPDPVDGISFSYSQLAVGTPDYVAPEQIVLGAEVDARADVYALGVLIYEMATLGIPRGSWVRPSRQNPKLGRAFDDLVEKALQPDPKNRFKSVRELRKRLEGCRRGPPPRFLIPALAATPVALGAMALFFAFRNSPSNPLQTGNPESQIPSPANRPDVLADPIPMRSTPYPPGLLPTIPRAIRRDSLPIEIPNPRGELVLFELGDDGNLTRRPIPDEVELQSVAQLKWIAPDAFVAPAKSGGVIQVDAKTGQFRYLLKDLTGIVKIEASQRSGLALREDGRVFTWPTGRSNEYLPPSEPISDVVDIAVGQNHALALIKGGTVRVWGQRAFGETSPPQQFESVAAIAAANHFSAVLTENGRVFVWGDNAEGQCEVPAFLPPVSQIACFENTVYALLGNGMVRSWGAKPMEDPYEKKPRLFRRLLSSPGGVVLSSPDGAMLMGEKTTGEWVPIAGDDIEKWKDRESVGDLFFRLLEPTVNHAYLLGWAEARGEASAGISPSSRKLVSHSRISGLAEGLGLGAIPIKATFVSRFSTSYVYRSEPPFGHALAINDRNELVAWGNNDFGQCNVPEIDGKVVDVRAGSNFSVALTDQGSVHIWGSNRRNQWLVPGELKNAKFIDTGSNHIVALDQEGRFFGWGNNFQGQCVPPNPDDRFRLVSAGGEVTMGVTKEGILKIWGSTRAYDRWKTPIAIRDQVIAPRKIKAGGRTCWVLLEDSTLYGWGDMAYGATKELANTGEYPRILHEVKDFWVGDRGLIVRFANGKLQGYNIALPGNELSAALDGCTDLSIATDQILEGL